MTPSEIHALAATCRCLQEDLGFTPTDCERPIEDLSSHQVILSFIEKRRQSPIGQETIRELAPKLIAYSLHSGRYRCATWHHEELGMVWLLAAAIHRDDSAQDAYRYFAQLQRDRRILPTREDISRVVRARASTFATSLLEDIPRLRRTALAQPGRIHDATIGGRVRIRFALESGDPAILTVAISERLLPGTLALPPRWEIQLLAAFFPNASFEGLSYTGEISGQPISSGEHGYCGVV